jgi:3-deoxy-D-manno-octulosonate 8-phosphate phosphatase (KDO 8-P phosphatase)
MLSNIVKIKAILCDIDGVLTDGGLIFDNEGNELKKFNAKDGQIVKYLIEDGFKLGAITGRKSQVVKNRCNELKFHFHKHGISNKLEEYENFKKEFNLKDEEIAYIGDDIIDLGIISRCGLSFTTNDARDYIKNEVDIIVKSNGGEGAYRDMCDYILEIQNKLSDIIQKNLRS